MTPGRRPLLSRLINTWRHRAREAADARSGRRTLQSATHERNAGDAEVDGAELVVHGDGEECGPGASAGGGDDEGGGARRRVGGATHGVEDGVGGHDAGQTALAVEVDKHLASPGA